MRSIQMQAGKWMRSLAAVSKWQQASLPKNRAQEIHPMIYGMDFGGKRTQRKERNTAAPSL